MPGDALAADAWREPGAGRWCDVAFLDPPYPMWRAPATASAARRGRRPRGGGRPLGVLVLTPHPVTARPPTSVAPGAKPRTHAAPPSGSSVRPTRRTTDPLTSNLPIHMKSISTSLLLCAASSAAGTAGEGRVAAPYVVDAGDEAAVLATMQSYVDGFYEGEPAHLERALELVKLGFLRPAPDDPSGTRCR